MHKQAFGFGVFAPGDDIRFVSGKTRENGSIYPEVKDLKAQKRRYHRNIRIEDNEIETFDVPLLYALSAEDVIWRNNRVTRHARYEGWQKPELIEVGCGRIDWQ